MTKKVLVGLSGGVDSAVTAHLLLQQGYDVAAGFMVNYSDEQNPHCHTKQDKAEAEKVAQFLGIQTFITFDFREAYDQTIIEYIYEGYKHGYTPNPDVLCNTKIKFDLFLKAAQQHNYDCIATGHYARISKDETGTYHLRKGKDTNKDQSYFLSGLNQTQLAHALFPLGRLTKNEVRNIALSIGLPNAKRKDSQGLCFIGKVPMKQFLLEHLPTNPGAIVSTTGETLGMHQGHYFYTVGQRQGLGLSGGPRYVVEKKAETNEIIVGPENDPALFSSTARIRDWHWIGRARSFPVSAKAKIRYRQPDQEIAITASQDDDILEATFNQAQRAITPGQVCVVYDNDELIGSGIIL